MTKIIRNLLLFSPLIFFVYTPWTLYPSIFGRTIIFQIIIELILVALLLKSLLVPHLSLRPRAERVAGSNLINGIAEPVPSEEIASPPINRGDRNDDVRLRRTPRNDNLYKSSYVIASERSERGNLKGVKQIFYSPIGISLVIFTLVQFVSYFFSVDREASFWGSMSRMDGIFSWLHMAAFFFLLVLFLNEVAPPNPSLVNPRHSERSSLEHSKESYRLYEIHGQDRDDAERQFKGRNGGVKSDWHKFLLINTAVASVLSILALIQRYHDLIPKYIIQSGRVYATFGNPVFFAPYLLFSIFLTAYLSYRFYWSNRFNPPDQSNPSYRSNRSYWSNWSYLLALGLQITALIFTDSQGAIFGFMAGLAALGWLFLFSLKSGKIKILALAAAVIAAGIFIVFKFETLKNLSQGKFNVIDGLAPRVMVWKMGLQGWQERPILGFGPSTFEYVFDKNYNPELLRQSFYETVSNKPHNIFVEVLDHTGLVGLAGYLGILLAAFWSLWKVRQQDRAFFILGVGLLAAYTVTLQFAFDTTNSQYMFMVFLAYLTYATRKTRIHSNDSNVTPPDPPLVNSRHSERSSLERSEESHKLYEIPRQARDDSWRSKFVFVLSCSSVLVLAAALWFGNIEALAAGAPAAKSENKYWLEKPILWANKVKEASLRRSPYHDEIRVIMAQDLIAWEAQGTLVVGEIKDQLKVFAEKLDESVKNHPRNFQYSFTAGQVFLLWAEYFDNTGFVQAEKILQNAARISPRRQAAYLMLGKLKLQKGDFAGALEDAKQAVNLDEQASDPHWFLGFIKVAGGNPEEGIREFQKARELGYQFKPPEIIYWMQVNKKLGKEEDNKDLEKLLK